MPEPRRKSFWRWEPLPYLAVLILLVFAGAVRPNAAPVLFWIVAPVTVVVVVAFVVMLIVQVRRPKPNPDASGDLATLDGLTVIAAAPTDGPRVPVDDVRRHQSAIEAAEAFATSAGRPVEAVLVPGATRWLALRLRVSVQLVGGTHISHGGFLPERAADRWQGELTRLRDGGIYLRVPVVVRGAPRSFTVEVDLGGLADAVNEADTRLPLR